MTCTARGLCCTVPLVLPNILQGPLVLHHHTGCIQILTACPSLLMLEVNIHNLNRVTPLKRVRIWTGNTVLLKRDLFLRYMKTSGRSSLRHLTACGLRGEDSSCKSTPKTKTQILSVAGSCWHCRQMNGSQISKPVRLSSPELGCSVP